LPQASFSGGPAAEEGLPVVKAKRA
jgi:hypothetical protein